MQNAGEDTEKWDHSHLDGGNVNWYSLVEKLALV